MANPSYPAPRSFPARLRSGETESREPSPLRAAQLVHEATDDQRSRAWRICVAMVMATGVMLPFAHVALGYSQVFFPIYQTAMLGTCLITAHLLYGHFRANGPASLLHLSAGYFYAGCVLFMQLLSFDGLTASGVRLWGGSQTTIWLWFFWHLAPALSVLHVALGKSASAECGSSRRSARRTTAYGLVAALVGTALLVFVFDASLPVLDVAGSYSLITSTGLAPALEVLLLAALAALWRASRFRDVLHVWLGVLVVALLCDNALTMLGGSRNTLGWYAGRMGALAGFSVLSLVYLSEITNSYLRSVAEADELSFSNSTLDSQLQERERYAEELVQADQRKDEFLVMLAHELRNPLAPMSTAAQLLSMGNIDAKLLKETSEMLGRQVTHMTALVDDLMDVSRFAQGFARLRKTPVNMQQVVSRSVEQSRPLLRCSRHDLEVRVPTDPVYILGDELRMVQVMTNMLNNAAKYTPPGGKILLHLQELGGKEVVLTIADNGVGMSPELVTRVFDLFSQGERTSERSQGGLGIGLSLVKSLVELHGGKVSAASSGPSLGSEFKVVLPRLERHHLTPALGCAGSARAL